MIGLPDVDILLGNRYPSNEEEACTDALLSTLLLVLERMSSCLGGMQHCTC